MTGQTPCRRLGHCRTHPPPASPACPRLPALTTVSLAPSTITSTNYLHHNHQQVSPPALLVTAHYNNSSHRQAAHRIIMIMDYFGLPILGTSHLPIKSEPPTTELKETIAGTRLPIFGSTKERIVEGGNEGEKVRRKTQRLRR